MQSAVSAAISYLETSRTAGTPEDMMESLTNDRIDNLKSMIGKSSMIMEDSTRAIALVGATMSFNATQKEVLLRAIHTKIQAGSHDQPDGAAAITQGQSNRFIEGYLTDDLNSTLDNKALPEEDRVDAFVDFIHLKHGCKYPDVPTRKRIVAIIHLCNGGNTTSLGLKACYDLLTKINNRKRIFRHHVPVTLRNFPQNPKDFMSLHPCLYVEGGPPVPSRFSSAVIDEVVAMTPARNTNMLLRGGSVQSSNAAAVVPSINHTMPAMGMPANMPPIMQMMGQMMQQMMNQQPGPPPQIRFNNRSSPYGTTPPRGILDGSLPAGCEQQDHEATQSHLSHPGSQHHGPRPTVDESNGLPAPKFEASPSTSQVHSVPLKSGAPSEAEDDIDAMIGKTPGKSTKPKKDDAVKKKKDTGKSTKSKTAATCGVFPRDNPPKFGTALPCIYNGCKIYGSESRYRVVPFPGKSAYDKPFKITKDNTKAVWTSLIEYCKKPQIPKTSANAIKIK
jgi:hypothetical protein